MWEPSLRVIAPVREMRTVMRYVYGGVAFIGVVALVLACLVALQRVLG
jgi:hypothetical protein